MIMRCCAGSPVGRCYSVPGSSRRPGCASRGARTPSRRRRRQRRLRRSWRCSRRRCECVAAIRWGRRALRSSMRKITETAVAQQGGTTGFGTSVADHCTALILHCRLTVHQCVKCPRASCLAFSAANWCVHQILRYAVPAVQPGRRKAYQLGRCQGAAREGWSAATTQQTAARGSRSVQAPRTDASRQPRAGAVRRKRLPAAAAPCGMMACELAFTIRAIQAPRSVQSLCRGSLHAQHSGKRFVIACAQQSRGWRLAMAAGLGCIKQSEHTVDYSNLLCGSRPAMKVGPSARGRLAPVNIHLDAGCSELAQLLGGFLPPPSWERRSCHAACDAT